MKPLQINLQALVMEGLKAGVHVNEIRKRLSREFGVHWEYTYNRHEGRRARARRLKQLSLCENECGRHVPPTRLSRICDGCLSAKWGQSSDS